jgi:hypothetical protein
MAKGWCDVKVWRADAVTRRNARRQSAASATITPTAVDLNELKLTRSNRRARRRILRSYISGVGL